MDQTVTTTFGGHPTTTIRSLAAAVSTVTAPSSGQLVGDINIILSPKGVSLLEETFRSAEAACGAGSLSKRDITSCTIDFLKKATESLDIPAFKLTTPLVAAGTVQAIAPLTLPFGVGCLFIMYKGYQKLHHVSQVFRLPKKFQAQSTPTSTPTPSTSSVKLAPYVTKNLPWTEGSVDNNDDAIVTFMAGILGSYFPTATKPSAPWCIHGADPQGNRIPVDYCQCGSSYATMYAVASSTSSPYNPCPFTTPPGSVLTFSASPSASPTAPCSTGSSQSCTLMLPAP